MSSITQHLKAALPPAACVTRALTTGQTLFRQGDAPCALFALTTGRIDLVRWTAQGTTVKLHSARAGQTLAEASIFADAYHCDAIACSDAQVLAFDLASIRTACAADPALSFALMRHLAESLRDARRIIELRTIQPLTERVLARLSDLADARGDLPEGLRMKDIAAEIGASPEATYRALGALVRAGQVARERRGVFRFLRADGAEPR